MIDDELRVLLSVEPSPGFEAGIRNRVSVGGPAVRWRLGHPAIMALAAALVVAVGIGLVSRSARQPDAPRAESPLVQRTAASPAAPPPVVAESTAIVPPRDAAQSRRRTTAVVATVADTRVPHVQIDRAESLALQRLFASPVNGTVVDVAPSPASELLFIPPIAIEPLTLEIRSEGVSQ
jgi:hypothetical protein